MMRIKTYALLLLTLWSGQSLLAQTEYDEYKKQYEINIAKEEINGVYIPTDIHDAIEKLDAMASPDSKAKIKAGQEEQVVENLSRGLGKWMIVNWNFYAGSRLSHALKQRGVTHPDDMAAYIVRTYYRHLHEQEYELDERADKWRKYRKELMEKKKKEQLSRLTPKGK